MSGILANHSSGACEEILLGARRALGGDLRVDGITDGDVGAARRRRRDRRHGGTPLGLSRTAQLYPIDGLGKVHAGVLESALDLANGLAAHFAEIGLALIHPGVEAHQHARIAEVLDQRHGRRLREHPGHLAELLDPQALRLDEIFSHPHPDAEIEAALGIAAVIEDHAFEDLGVGDAQMIAVERHQNRGAGGPSISMKSLAVKG